MILYEDNQYVFISMAYYSFCNEIMLVKENGRYLGPIKNERFLSGQEINAVVSFVYGYNAKKLLVVDMKYVSNISDHFFEKLKNLKNKLICFTNLSKLVRDELKAELPPEIMIGRNCIFANKQSANAYRNNCKKIEQTYVNKSAQIIREMVEELDEDDIRPLDSSNVYCNTYVNMKKLFVNPDWYNYIMFQLVQLIAPEINQVDALICASKNGANIASNLGWLFNKKVVYCMNLGPKFSVVRETLLNEIRQEKKYAFIYDFICLGTELKTLNALVGVLGAKLIAGYGIANYIELPETTVEGNILEKMHSVINLQEACIEYRIAGTKKEIVQMRR